MARSHFPGLSKTLRKYASVPKVQNLPEDHVAQGNERQCARRYLNSLGHPFDRQPQGHEAEFETAILQ